jgi:signal transduction histidine kinase
MGNPPESKPPFTGPSEMHARINAHAWESTPVGPIARWPQSLRATIKTLLGSRYPMILLWGPDLVQIYNEAYIGLIGDKHPGALGRSIRETQAESWEIIGPMIHEVMTTGTPNWVPAQILPLERSGYREESYFSLSYSAVDDDEGRIAGMLCVCSEVTQQVLGERRTRFLRNLTLRASETRSTEATCRDIAAAMEEEPLDVPFALLYLREDDETTMTLRGAAGLKPGEPGVPLALRLDDETAGWPVAQTTSGQSVLVEDVARRMALSGGPFRDGVRAALVLPIASADPGTSLGVLIAGISPNRALDEGYRSFYELLTAQVSVALRNARAYEDERRRAEVLAELDRAKTTFFNNVSHEFRTPLTLILGPLEDLLASRRLTDENRRELEVVHRNAGRLLRLVNTLLDFGRLEAGRVEASYEPTDLASSTADLASSFRSALERAGLSFKVDCPALSQPVYVDREMWEKIVLNLLSNAFKFTFEGGITVCLREVAGSAKLEVIDTGIGIPSSELPHLFERFHRVRGAKSRTHEGTGIGLALVRELVKLLGGEVMVASSEGQGTTFGVTLPLGQRHLPKDRIRAARKFSSGPSAEAYVDEALRWLPRPDNVPPSLPSVQARAFGSNRAAPIAARILVVDDNADMREYLTRVLSPSFEVVAADDGQAALERVESGAPFDLVLTDVMMPRLGGFGLLRALRADPRTRAVPIVMLSARAGEEASVEGLEAGADDYLVKPFSARELIARMHSTLELSRMRREVAAHEAREASLEESVRARDEFISIASHELKTPLTPLHLHLDSIQRSAQAGGSELDARRLIPKLETMARQVDRLEKLVDTLLDIARITSHRVDVECEDVDLAEVVRDVAGRFVLGSPPAATFEFDVPEKVIGSWDKLRLEQIVSNLLSNATKFGGGRPIRIAVEASAGWVRLTVRDEGIGIAPEDQARIFERFERAVPTRHYGGFGLGLWIVRQIVEALGGIVEVESGKGNGSLFAVKLPLRDQRQLPKEPPRPLH